MELSVTTRRHDDVSVVTVDGEVDVYTAAQLRQTLDEEIAAGNIRLVVDLDDVGFLDSTGLGVLVGRLKLVRNDSGWLRIVCSSERILRVFRITGLDKVFAIHPTVDEGRVPVVVHLQSPAGRDVQVTADLPGFWAGSWSDVRKDMAGRYPKHDWPLDPATATPSRPGERRR